MRVQASIQRAVTGVFCALLAIAIAFGMVPLQANAAGLRAGSLAPAAEGTTSVLVGVKYGQTEARSMLAMINAFRTGPDAWAWNSGNTEKVSYSGLGELAYDYELERVAKLRAVEIALSFSHTRPDGVSGAWDALDGWTSVGENIAAGYTNARSAFVGWQETDEPYSGQGHRRNMLNSRFAAVGIGHVVVNGYHYWVQEFCSPVLDATATVADDGAGTVKVDVADSVVKKRAATASPSSVALEIGESTALPSVSARIGTDETWPAGTVPVLGTVETWSSKDASIAAISGGSVKGLKAGSTTLVASIVVAGSTVEVSVPVEVERAAEPAKSTGVSKSVKAVKAANPMKVSAKTATVKYSKKKAQTVKASKAYSFKKKAVGKVIYARVAKGSSKWLPKVNAKTGAIAVKAGAPKGKTQKVKVKVTAKGNASYKPLSKTVTVKVRVR